MVRLDHFRGFESYWAVPAGETTAKNGSWQPGPGMDFIGVLNEKYLPDWAREKLMELTAPRQEEPAAGEMKLE